MLTVLLDGTGIRSQGAGKGVSRAQYEIIRRVVSSGSQFRYVIAVSEEAKAPIAAADIVIVPPGSGTYWQQVALPRLAKRIGAKLIYTQTEVPTIWGNGVVAHAFENPLKRRAYAQETSAKQSVASVWNRLAIKRGLQRAKRVVVSSHAIRAEFQGSFGLSPESINVVPLGVDRDVFYPRVSQERESLSSEFIFHLGSDDEREATDRIVIAYKQALERDSSLPKLIIGGRMDKKRTTIQELAANLGVSDRVELCGWLADDDLRRYYAECIMCIHASVYEGFGLQALEALACGASLISFPDPAVVEVVHRAAVISRGFSPADLTEEMVKLWREPERRSALAREGPIRAGEFTWERTAERICAVLSGAVDD